MARPKQQTSLQKGISGDPLSVNMLIPPNLVFGANECRTFTVQILEGSPEEYDPWLTGHRPKAVCVHYNRMLSI